MTGKKLKASDYLTPDGKGIMSSGAERFDPSIKEDGHGNEFYVPLTDPRLKTLGINPSSLVGAGKGITEKEVIKRLNEMER